MSILLSAAPRLAATRGIRPCVPRDLAEVADLFVETFPDAGYALDRDSLAEYMHTVYLDNPWLDDEMPSLVYENHGRVEGFLGVVPRPMKSHGRRIRTASPSALMVRRDANGKRNPATGIQLLRRFLDGPQDLSVTDTANAVTKRLWTTLGGHVARPYCYTWARPIRPLEAACHLSGVALPEVVRALGKPFYATIDQVLKRVPPFKPNRTESVVADMDAGEHVRFVEALRSPSLVPSYDVDSLEWQYAVAGQSDDEGEFARRVVQDADGKALGWFVYYRTRGGIARVLQIGAFPGRMDDVFDALLADADRFGIAVLWGRTEPEHAELLTEKKCVFFGQPWVLVHARERELVDHFQYANAYFTGLDGELWLKFNG